MERLTTLSLAEQAWCQTMFIAGETVQSMTIQMETITARAGTEEGAGEVITTGCCLLKIIVAEAEVTDVTETVIVRKTAWLPAERIIAAQDGMMTGENHEIALMIGVVGVMTTAGAAATTGRIMVKTLPFYISCYQKRHLERDAFSFLFSCPFKERD